MNLLAAVGAWILDVVFFALILLGTLFGVWRGFVKGLCKLAGTIFAIGVAISFCVPMKNSLETTFSMVTAIANGIHSPVAANWISIAISFILLVVIVKLGAWILGKVGTVVVDKFAPLRTVNHMLGGILGAAEAFLFVLILLAIFYWINDPSINTFITTSSIVGRIFEGKWFMWALRFM